MNVLSRIRFLLVFFFFSQVLTASFDPMLTLSVEDIKTSECLVTCKVVNLSEIGLSNVYLIKADNCFYAKGQDWPPYIALLCAAQWIAIYTDARAICVQKELIVDSGCASYIAMLPGVNQAQSFQEEGIEGYYWSVALEEEVGFFLRNLLNAAFDVGSVVSVRQLFERMWHKLEGRMSNPSDKAAGYYVNTHLIYDPRATQR